MINLKPFITRIGIGAAAITVTAFTSLTLFSQNDGEQQEARYQAPQFSSFEMVFERNIFDPNRRPAHRNEEPRPVLRPDPDETILTGTMIVDNESYAFFQGTQSDFRAVVSTGNTYLGFQVDTIETTKIILKNDTRTIEMPVGMALQKEADSDWELITPTGSVRNTDSEREARSMSSSSNQSNRSDASSGDDVQNDVLKRLMEQRRQEAGS